MIYNTRTHTIDAAHRVYGHEGKCMNLHGHRYKFEFTLRSKSGLDTLGRVIDFSQIKALLCNWLDEHWDHKTLLYSRDPLYMMLKKLPPHLHDPRAVISLPVNPTAENIAQHFSESIASGLLLDTGIVLIRCVVYETEKCSATFVDDNESAYVKERVDAEDATRNG